MNEVSKHNITNLMRLADTNQRQADLVRYARGYLFDKELITPEEYTAIACENVGAPTRLEDYDQVQATLGAENAKLKADNEKLLVMITNLVQRFQKQTTDFHQSRVGNSKKWVELHDKLATMREALKEVRLRAAFVGHPGEAFYDRGDGVMVPDWRDVLTQLEEALNETTQTPIQTL